MILLKLNFLFYQVIKPLLNYPILDASYADPIGEAPLRPKTAGGHGRPQVEDEFADEEIGDDLLPD